MRSSPLQFSICKAILYSCFHAKAGLPPGRSAPLPCAACSEPGLPKQHKPLALVGVAQHGCPRRAGAELLSAGFSGLVCVASRSSASLIQLQECWIWDTGSCLGMGRGMSASSEAVCNAGETNQKQESELICPGFLLNIGVEGPWKSVRVLDSHCGEGEWRGPPVYSVNWLKYNVLEILQRIAHLFALTYVK